MGAEARETDTSLIHKLLEKPHLFSFFQAVLLLERYASSVGEIASVGYQGPVALEAIAFRPDASLAFPVSDIVSIEKIGTDDDQPPRFRLTTSFLGLYGANSPLPDFYTEDILWADPEESFAREFLDIFHHRLLSLFYRCWLKYRYYLQFEPDGKDEFSQRIFSLIGMGTPGLVTELGLPPVRLLRYSGLIAQQPRSATALEGFLSNYFGGLPVRIEQCIGRWVVIADTDCIALGGRNNQLGLNMTIGERVFDRAGKFRISIGAMKFAEFVKFLPDGECFQAMREIVQFFLMDALEFESELILLGTEVPELCLSSSEGARLGWTSWLISRQPDDNVSVIFQTV